MPASAPHANDSVARAAGRPSTTFCLCEDRGMEEIGLRLAVCGLRRHCPSAEIVVYRSEPTPDFARWLDERGVVLVPERPAGAASWNCKPHALLPLLREGRPQVVWLDSDVLVNRPCDALFESFDERELAVCEEYRGAPHPGSELRTRGWGLPVARSFPRTLNTAVLRLTPRHIPLLERWKELLADPRYVPWQTRPLEDRPPHCWGDQDVLNALLGSTEFADVPVRLLRTGREVVHCSSLTSFTALERLRCAPARPPYFVHGQGAKPWVVLDAAVRDRYSRRERLIQELSPYRTLARAYESEMGRPCAWLHGSSATARICSALAGGNYALAGLPAALAAQFAKTLRDWTRSLRGNPGVAPNPPGADV